LVLAFPQSKPNAQQRNALCHQPGPPPTSLPTATGRAEENSSCPEPGEQRNTAKGSNGDGRQEAAG